MDQFDRHALLQYHQQAITHALAPQQSQKQMPCQLVFPDDTMAIGSPAVARGALFPMDPDGAQETEEEREGPGWVRSLSPSLPVSGGLASVCWTNTRQVATVSCGGELAVWDPATARPTGRHSLPGGELQQGWASCGPGYHPASLLVTDRLAANILDTRSGSWTSLGLSPAGQTDPVRHLDCEGPPPYCYLLTDTRLLLCDLRMPRAPVLSRLTGLGRATASPTSLMARARLESEDWVVAGDCWANTCLTVLDWDHAHCQAQSDDLWLHCQPGEGPPRVLGGVQPLPSWRDSVVTARALGGQWLHPALEQRAALPFTGLALSAQPGPGGNVNVVAVNAIGDLFGMVLHLEEDEEDVGCDEAERFVEEESSLF